MENTYLSTFQTLGGLGLVLGTFGLAAVLLRNVLERRRELESALDGLSARERAVFVLVELEGLDRSAAARSLGITSITVRRHLSRARASLRTILVDARKKTVKD